ncbi:MAG TPA: phosphopantetheine-binding protein [Vicinamibacterales bacterium]|nr:phosphopantetheine-binding protein [Vicinamibacterales bacterium]
MTDALRMQIKQAIVRSLRLPMKPEEIGDSTPLFGEGLGLDSIDVLELVLELERSFGVSITDQDTGLAVLRSVETIATYIEANRSEKPA